MSFNFLFVAFIALIYLSCVKKQMLEAKLFDKRTMQGLPDDLDAIELFEAPGHGRVLGEVTKKQKDVYMALGVIPPRYDFREPRFHIFRRSLSRGAMAAACMPDTSRDERRRRAVPRGTGFFDIRARRCRYIYIKQRVKKMRANPPAGASFRRARP